MSVQQLVTITDTPWTITLTQHRDAVTHWCVRYGNELKTFNDPHDAMDELHKCLNHAFLCDGRVDFLAE